MTNEQINRAVAEELGWTNIRPRYAFGPALLGIETRYQQECRVPDFCNDHNAAAEMLKVIKTKDERATFVVQLLRLLISEDPQNGYEDYAWVAMNATPRQQAEAFLKMRGKWREG